jgi:hypothetical protein
VEQGRGTISLENVRCRFQILRDNSIEPRIAQEARHHPAKKGSVSRSRFRHFADSKCHILPSGILVGPAHHRFAVLIDSGSSVRWLFISRSFWIFLNSPIDSGNAVNSNPLRSSSVAFEASAS